MKIDYIYFVFHRIIIILRSLSGPMGKVYVASMNLRGKWAPKPKGAKFLNVTSAQQKNSATRLAFSPMTPIEGGYKGFYCFENYWQSGKVKEGVDQKISHKWWKSQTKGRRRYPKGGKTLFADYGDGKRLDYL